MKTVNIANDAGMAHENYELALVKVPFIQREIVGCISMVLVAFEKSYAVPLVLVHLHFVID